MMKVTIIMQIEKEKAAEEEKKRDEPTLSTASKLS
jgi:hypothetical protein